MKNVKIVEGTAEYIEAVLEEEESNYYLDSLQFIHRSLMMHEGRASEQRTAFYAAVLRKVTK